MKKIKPTRVARICCFQIRKFSSVSLRVIGIEKWCKEDDVIGDEGEKTEEEDDEGEVAEEVMEKR